MIDLVISERRGNVMHLTLNHAERLNAFSPPLTSALRAALDELTNNPHPDIKALMLQANGRFFSAGGDIKFFRSLLTEPEQVMAEALGQLIDDVNAIVLALLNLPFPVVAVVQGGASGFALSLLAACDWVIAASESHFSSAYVGIGATPDGGSTWLLPQRMGWQAARRFMMMNERCTAEAALRLNLVDELVPADDLFRAAQARANQWTSASTFAIGQLRRLLASAHQQALTHHMALEKASFMACSMSPDFKARLNEFGK